MSKVNKLNCWRIDKKPPVMTRKFTFESYEETRSFVHDLSELSEKIGYYPNLTFSQSHATVTIYTDEKELSDNDFEFAKQTDKIADLYIEKVGISHD